MKSALAAHARCVNQNKDTRRQNHLGEQIISSNRSFFGVHVGMCIVCRAQTNTRRNLAAEHTYNFGISFVCKFNSRNAREKKTKSPQLVTHGAVVIFLFGVSCERGGKLGEPTTMGKCGSRRAWRQHTATKKKRREREGCLSCQDYHRQSSQSLVSCSGKHASRGGNPGKTVVFFFCCFIHITTGVPGTHKPHHSRAAEPKNKQKHFKTKMTKQHK